MVKLSYRYLRIIVFTDKLYTLGGLHMTKKYYIIFLIISIIITIATSSIKLSKNRIMAGSAKSFKLDSIEQLVENSPLIIIGEVKGKKDAIKENKVSYKVSEVEISEILKGNTLFDNETLQIMQMSVSQDPVVKEGEKVLLFLEKYKGASVENGYVCVGLGQGYYKIKDKSIEPAVTLSYALKKSIESKNNIIEYVRLHAAVALE